MLVTEYRSTPCPKCGHGASRIVQSWVAGWCRSRRHVCRKCGETFLSRQDVPRTAGAGPLARKID